ncbi:unnamed protein product [Cylicostephanus goldi]|uniref:Cyclin N-terminal domain-containing protein n=1 Tax=Cylicostephanus goldi TaxID=71465 RepID=A0A3P6QLF1_CYLGO|nr:unnamed protein product [Cylicostephanus goldi]
MTSFSGSEREDNTCSEYNEELENDAFRELEAGLNDQSYQTKEVPPQLTALRCTGIGSPKKVWGLLCRKDELIRASHHVLDNHPDLAPRTRAVLVDWMMEVSFNFRIELSRSEISNSRSAENHATVAVSTLPSIIHKNGLSLLYFSFEVCGSEKQHRETFHLAVDYVDRFLATFHGIRSQTFQMVGTSALFLASKYEVCFTRNFLLDTMRTY